MQHVYLKAGTTSAVIEVDAWDKSKTDASRLTALAYNTASLTCHYHRQGAAAEEAVTLADMTLGTFASGGFKELDATNCPGLYQFCPPDAALATGAAYCDVTFKGAANLAQEVVRIHLSPATQVAGMDTDVLTAAAVKADAVTKIQAGLSTFDPATDVVAHVTLVDTTTTNTDMRGTDGAATAIGLAAHDAKLDGVAVNAASAAGADFGEDECTLTITDTTSAALSDAQVYVYVGAARSRVKTTDSLGQVKFDLTDGETYNLWVTHDRYTGTNPTSFVASKDV